MSATLATYRKDILYPRIVRAVDVLLQRSNVVAPVDVLVEMGLLAPAKLEDWRRGRIPYLERAIDCNLAKLSRILRLLRFHAHDLCLQPSRTFYRRWGKGHKQALRFTKTGERKLEEVYATHLVWPAKEPFHARKAKMEAAAAPASAAPPVDAIAAEDPPVRGGASR